jgi:hypothetical protein
MEKTSRIEIRNITMLNLKKIPEVVKKNIEISKEYLELYPSLVRYEEIRKEIREKGRTKVPKSLHEESSKIWDKFRYLKLNKVSNFLYETTGESEKYLTGELTADPIEVLKEIKKDIKKYLNSSRFKPTYKYYDHEEHLSVIEMEKQWSKVKTKEDFFKVLTDPYDYTAYGDFCPFHNTNKHRKAKLINIVITNNLNVKDELSPLDLELSTFRKVLDRPNKEKALTDRKQFEEDQKTIEKVIEMMIPLCERAKAEDECWDNNFLNNKVMMEIKRRMKK